MKRNLGLLGASLLLACTSSKTAPPADTDTQAPTLQVITPARGTMSQGNQVNVTGMVQDDHPIDLVTVTVNGTNAVVNPDGTFAATITVGSGIELIETHAVDGGGNDARDVRSVLAGTLVASDGTAVSSLGVMVGAAGFHAIGAEIATQAKQTDFTALGLAMNPVYTSSGCNSATINIETITVGDITADLVPTTGALGAIVDLDNVTVVLHVDFHAICISGSATVTVTSTKAHVTGDLALALTAGHLVATMPTAAVTLDGFAIDVHNVPSALTDLITGQAQSALETALTNAVKAKVPQIATNALSKVVATSLTTSMLGHDVQMAVTPGSVSLAPDGLFLAATTTTKLVGGETGTFSTVATPLTSSTIAASGFGIAIAGDTLNQLLSGAWAAGALEETVSNLGAVGAFLDPSAKALKLHLMLPPAISAESGALALALGDLIVSVRDASDVELQQIAVELTTPLQLSADATGALTFSLGTPTIKAQVLVQTAEVQTPLTDAKFEAILTGGWGLLADKAQTALSGLHLPTITGVTLGTPTVTGTSGYITADVPLM